MTREMQEWAYYAMDAIHALAQEDPDYLSLNEKRLGMEAEYERVMAGLPQAQRELIEDYQRICEEMQFQKIRLAYFLGRKHREEIGKK